MCLQELLTNSIYFQRGFGTGSYSRSFTAMVRARWIFSRRLELGVFIRWVSCFIRDDNRNHACIYFGCLGQSTATKEIISHHYLLCACYRLFGCQSIATKVINISYHYLLCTDSSICSILRPYLACPKRSRITLQLPCFLDLTCLQIVQVVFDIEKRFLDEIIVFQNQRNSWMSIQIITICLFRPLVKV